MGPNEEVLVYLQKWYFQPSNFYSCMPGICRTFKAYFLYFWHILCCMGSHKCSFFLIDYKKRVIICVRNKKIQFYERTVHFSSPEILQKQ